jgi:phosphoglycerol transferase MdoB-like AlkP superfamily enzyme
MGIQVSTPRTPKTPKLSSQKISTIKASSSSTALNTVFIYLFYIFGTTTFIVSMYIYFTISLPEIKKLWTDLGHGISKEVSKDLSKLQKTKIWMFVVSSIHIVCLLGIFFNMYLNLKLMKLVLVPLYLVLACIYIYIITKDDPVIHNKDHKETVADQAKDASTIELFFVVFILDLLLHLLFVYAVDDKKLHKNYKTIKPFDFLDFKELLKLLGKSENPKRRTSPKRSLSKSPKRSYDSILMEE